MQRTFAWSLLALCLTCSLRVPAEDAPPANSEDAPPQTQNAEDQSLAEQPAAEAPTEEQPQEPAAQAPAQEAPAPDVPTTVSVNVIAYIKYGDGTVQGDCRPVIVTAGGGVQDNRVRVGFFETEAAATGDMWRSAGWMAAITAAQITDFNPRAARVSYEYEGGVDGPSAGALMTTGVIAAVRGDTVRPDIAMTGTINPDGTIGPVGGIAHKIDGAAAKGMKVVLIPSGALYGQNLQTGEEVDYIEHGRELGVDVKPVFNIYQAYKLFTGVDLPRPPAAEMPRVAHAVNKEVEKKISEWYRLYAKALNSYTKMPGTAKLSQEAIDMYQQGLDIIKHAEEMANEGEITAAYWDHVRAAMYAYLALELGRCRQTYAARGYGGMVERLNDNQWLEDEVRRVGRRMRAEPPKTLDQLSMFFSVCDAYLEALSLQQIAKETLSELSDEDSNESQAQAVSAASNQIIAWINLKLAEDYLDLAVDYGGPPIPANAPWREASEFFRRAAMANSAVFDALIVGPQAKADGVSKDAVKAQFMASDGAYAILQVSHNKVFPNLHNYVGTGEALNCMNMATNLYLHTRAAGLLAKYYSLDAELDENKNVVAIGKERTLGQWLTFAEDQSRRSIARLQEEGIDATTCIQIHEIARIKAHRDLNEKLEALYEFWSSDLHAQVLHRMAVSAGRDAAAAQ